MYCIYHTDYRREYQSPSSCLLYLCLVYLFVSALAGPWCLLAGALKVALFSLGRRSFSGALRSDLSHQDSWVPQLRFRGLFDLVDKRRPGNEPSLFISR